MLSEVLETCSSSAELSLSELSKLLNLMLELNLNCVSVQIIGLTKLGTGSYCSVPSYARGFFSFFYKIYFCEFNHSFFWMDASVMLLQHAFKTSWSRLYLAICNFELIKLIVNWFSTLLAIHTKPSLPLFNKICSMVFKHMKFWRNISIRPLFMIIFHEVIDCILWKEINVNVEKDVKSLKVKYY